MSLKKFSLNIVNHHNIKSNIKNSAEKTVTTSNYGQPQQKIAQYLEEMPSLSTTAIKVIEICNQAVPCPRALNQAISLDPVLTGQILKLVNSAYFSLRHKITTLIHAITMLGINTVKNLTLSSAIMSCNRRNRELDTTIEIFWKHSLSVAVTARELASIKAISETQKEDFFIAGLLHDIGKLAMLDCFTEAYKEYINFSSLRNRESLKKEAELFAVNHCECGLLIAEKWQLPTQLKDVIENHHNSVKTLKSPDKTLLKLVTAANNFTNYNNLLNSDANNDESKKLNLLARISGISAGEIPSFQNKIAEEILKAQIFLQL